MKLLDRIRPKWHHSDPEVRLSAVRQLGKDDQELLSAVALEDQDVRVRRSAIKRLEDPAKLEEVSERDPNEGLRELAAERAADILTAVAASDGAPAVCEEALVKLSNPRHLARVAISASHRTIQEAALGQLSDDRALADVVRKASVLGLRKEALGKLGNPSLLQAIATSDVDSELALAAVEKISDPESLYAIARERSAHKNVRQRAEARFEAVITDDHPLRVEQRRKRQDELSKDVEELAKEPLSATEKLQEAQAEWDDLADKTQPDETAKERFQAARQAIADEVARQKERRLAMERRKAEIQENLAARLALCQKVESLDGETTLQDLQEARAAWQALQPLPSSPEGEDNDAVELTTRFERAVERGETGYESSRAEEAFRIQLKKLFADADKFADSTPLPDAVRDWPMIEKRWAKIEASREAERWKELTTSGRQRFILAGERLTERRKKEAEQQEQLQQKNLDRLKEFSARIDKLVQSKELSLKAADRELKKLPQVLKDLGPLPSTENRRAWKDRLTKARHDLYTKFQDQRETEEWRRWANVDIQEKLIQKAEELAQSEDLAAVSTQLRQIQQEWKRVGAAPRAKSEALWKRFSQVRDELHARCDAFFADNFKKKEALCEKVEALADSNQWNKTAEAIKKAQAEWKELGPVPQKHAKAIWRRFRAPCDQFFERRKEQLDQLKHERDSNSKKKIELCEQVEALADSKDWDETAKQIKQLQAKWKTVGPVPHKKSDALWNRFRKACDHFFDRRKRRGELEIEDKLENKASICERLEALAASVQADDAPPAEAVTKEVQEAWAEWTDTGTVPLEQAEPLDTRLQKSCEQIVAVFPESLQGTPLDPRANRKRRKKLCTRLEELVGSYADTPGDAPVEDLAQKLKQALAANTIGGAAVIDKTKNWRAATQEVERLKANWERLGPIIGDMDRALSDRFRKAYTHFFELRKTPGSGGRPVKHAS